MNAPFDLYGDHAHAHVTALLTVLADPAAHKQRLDELIAQEKAAKDQIAALNEMAADTRRQNSAAKAANIVVERRVAALDAKEAELNERAEQLERSESTRSDASLKRREVAVEARENAARAEVDRLAVMRKDYEARLAKLKNFSSTL